MLCISFFSVRYQISPLRIVLVEEKIIAMIIPLTSVIDQFEHIVFFASKKGKPPHHRHAVSGIDVAQLSSFELFFRTHERQITAYLYRMLSNEQTALDLSQETFIRAWEHYDQLQEPEPARAWLYRVATNLALRHLERQNIHAIQELDDALPGSSDPSRRIVEHDLVQQILLTLTPKQRSTLVLHEVHDLSCEDIGEILHMSRDAVKMALWRGREQFRIHYLREMQFS